MAVLAGFFVFFLAQSLLAQSSGFSSCDGGARLTATPHNVVQQGEQGEQDQTNVGNLQDFLAGEEEADPLGPTVEAEVDGERTAEELQDEEDQEEGS